MLWEIICYNGDSYKSDRQETLTEFLARWAKENHQTELNIKHVINHH
ncbi:hypothetical protein ST201phi2-1p016 [Pseudomonas phage 201phi2-1]|uniref:Uncharacterized protein n=1 Tax=Pseudomonas phage 201phi2-1 TaxID=198110 RepID=B3FJZ2_BP201|nr:hypothetical protein ST201phi2-1p016 [Pseudomonas phage 201phi2-1]ABY62850.1 hypothetical protein 201phi2-1p016 [Pseudomonas phage 201phi2-1]